ncbi:hypothetical protein PIB30_074439 [Stylosanthes scabra]|uniref:Uncharacterized protein n=1 Tax=Stylosanthes scabra TaxID=79078 RepID=A0ABU6VN31_9FABA|nr:hypothetical protein [Stylosanthes scabra]
MASSSAQSCSFCLLHRFSALRLLCTFDAILQKRRRRFAFDAILCHSKKKKKKRDGGGDDASDDGVFMVAVAVIEKGIRVWELELGSEKFITHQVPFSEINKAFECMIKGESLRGSLGSIIRMNA